MSPADSTCPNNDILDILEIVSVVTIAISMILMLVSLLTHLISRLTKSFDNTELIASILNRKLRSKPSSRLFVNLCLSLMVLYGTYIGALFGRANSSVCILFAALFQYGLYVVLLAMIANSAYLVLILWYPKPSQRYAVVTPFITWSKLSDIKTVKLTCLCYSFTSSDSRTHSGSTSFLLWK